MEPGCHELRRRLTTGATDFNLRIFDGSTGQLIESIANTGDSARAANHPDWSSDGNTIAYARVSRNGPRGVSLQWPTHGRDQPGDEAAQRRLERARGDRARA